VTEQRDQITGVPARAHELRYASQQVAAMRKENHRAVATLLITSVEPSRNALIDPFR
jgi:hypothetical protein